MAKTERRNIDLVIRGRNQSGKAIKGATRGIKNLGRSILDFRKIAAGAILGGGVAAIGKSLIQAASDAEETQSKFDAVFKEESEAAEKFADDFTKSIGRGKTELKGFLASIQDTFVPLGFAREEARKLSQQTVQLAIDLASFNNIADSEALARLQGALIGNHENVRKFGVIITEATLKQELFNMGVAGGTRAATNQEKALARLNLIIKGTSDAQGDAIRTGDGFANTLKRMEGAFADLKESTGKQLLPFATEFVKSLGDAISAVNELDERTRNLRKQTGKPAADAAKGTRNIFSEDFWVDVFTNFVQDPRNKPGQGITSFSPGEKLLRIRELEEQKFQDRMAGLRSGAFQEELREKRSIAKLDARVADFVNRLEKEDRERETKASKGFVSAIFSMEDAAFSFAKRLPEALSAAIPFIKAGQKQEADLRAGQAVEFVRIMGNIRRGADNFLERFLHGRKGLPDAGRDRLAPAVQSRFLTGVSQIRGNQSGGNNPINRVRQAVTDAAKEAARQRQEVIDLLQRMSEGPNITPGILGIHGGFFR